MPSTTWAPPANARLSSASTTGNLMCKGRWYPCRGASFKNLHSLLSLAIPSSVGLLFNNSLRLWLEGRWMGTCGLAPGWAMKNGDFGGGNPRCVYSIATHSHIPTPGLFPIIRALFFSSNSFPDQLSYPSIMPRHSRNTKRPRYILFLVLHAMYSFRISFAAAGPNHEYEPTYGHHRRTAPGSFTTDTVAFCLPTRIPPTRPFSISKLLMHLQTISPTFTWRLHYVVAARLYVVITDLTYSFLLSATISPHPAFLQLSHSSSSTIEVANASIDNNGAQSRHSCLISSVILQKQHISLSAGVLLIGHSQRLARTQYHAPALPARAHRRNW
ncbi:hypothetical protein MIND_01148500 [Mycena indigotica]|uniref:Uncharacterized protein n=1 Tax=Mycena indigotica TaxID=2126181 RepID=A0A8H6S7M9_9AGAR|nr:uncharacterized protein MIND_01148500 [Mycena indigotica]KAF7293685.1 hypothetical protein MIND_01148500 [Mycena indigotica]